MAIDVVRLHHYTTPEGSMIAVSFPMTEPCKTLVKKLSGRRWCSLNKWIYVKNTVENLKEIFNIFKGIAWIDGREYFSRGAECNTEVRIINSIKKKRTYVHFPYGAKPEWVDAINGINGAFHIIRTGDWTIPGNNENYKRIKAYFEGEGCSVKTKNIDLVYDKRREVVRLKPNRKPGNKKYLDAYKDMLTLKRVSLSTIKNYLSMFSRFLAYFDGIEPENLSKNDIIKYLLWEIQKNGISINLQNQMINAIKYYYEKVLGRPREIYNLPRPKVGRTEPVVLNNDELQKILSGIVNIKHRCIISLIFSAGLRRHELINMRLQDIDTERRVINIHKGKGNKDRISILADTTARYIHEYIIQYEPKYWLFEGRSGEQYSAESIWKIFNQLKKRFNIEKKGNVHLLRHTFATNLLEAGTDIRYIQKLLGHSHLKTTEVYTHISNNNLLKIKSPIDQLDI
jgi:site-specific recombinase XerD